MENLNLGIVRICRGQYELLLASVAKEESQYALAGVCLDVIKGKLWLVATDTFRLTTCEVETNAAEALSKIVDHKMILTLQALKGRIQQKATAKDPFYVIDLNGIRQNEMTEGKFPQYINIIPKDYGKGIDETEAFKIGGETEAIRMGDTAFNMNYLLDIFKYAKRINQTVIAYGKEQNAAIIGSVQGGFVHLLSPVCLANQ